MTPAEYERVRDLLAEALEKPAEQRDAFVAGACGGDDALAGELRALLAAHEGAARDGFLDAPAIPGSAAVEAGSGPAPGRRVGPYEVVEELGRGGMGVVLRAVRADDTYRKAVAIKLVPEAGLSSRARQRFVEERQILAGLEHPNIARLLDGGTTEEGIPYLVMELVEGEPIDTFCDRRRLGIDERLRLFLPVAAAVHHAHRSLVVHRDLKPSNVLVTREGVPKLLDFGIARFFGPGSDGATVTAARALTPGYASPEQLRGAPLGTATDVYSLGVVLYELLAGRRPHRTRGDEGGRAELAATSSGREPDPPSAAVRREEPDADPDALASARGTTPRALRSRLRGDLDTIVLTALRDDPGRRYGSAEAFADDVRRHLDGRPVRARPPTVRYRAGKFVRRNRALVGAAAAALLLLLGGVLATSREARRAEAQRIVAERRFADVRRLAHALLFDVHDAVAPLAGSTGARELLVREGLAYLDGLAREASGDRSLEVEVALAYQRVGDLQGGTFMANLGDVPGAVASYRKAASLLERNGPRGAAEEEALVNVLCALSSAEALSGDPPGARRDAERALALARGAPPAAARAPTRQARVMLSRALFAVSFAAFHRGDGGPAEAAGTEQVRLLEALRAEHADDAEIASLLAGAHWSLAGILWSAQRLPAAVEHYGRALELQEAVLRAHPENGRALRQLAYTAEALGALHGQLGHAERGLPLLRRAVDARRSLTAGDPHNADARLSLLAARKNLAFALALARRPAEAAAELEVVSPELEADLAAAPRSVPLRKLLAETRGVWSLVHAARAETARGAARQRHTSARRASLSSALAVWRGLDAEGALGAQDRGTYEDVARELARCERELAAAVRSPR